MPFIEPSSVTSPKAHWEFRKVIYSTGQGGWSVASGNWDGFPVTCIRWNGSNDEENNGSPQSRGYPTWFVVPSELERALLREVDRINKAESAVSCEISRPEDYDIGAWKVEMSLSPEVSDLLHDFEIIFQIPHLPKRMFKPDKGYYAAKDGQLHGLFVKGKWKGHLYSNGIGEADNPTEIEVVKNAITRNVRQVLQNQTIKN